MGSPQIFVRFIALKDEKEIPKGATVAIVWTLLADSGAVLTRMLGRALLTGPGIDPEEILGSGAEAVLPQLVSTLLPAFLVGIFTAIVLSAIMSTVDSLLILASSAAVRDVYQKLLHPELSDAQLLDLSRKVTLMLAVIALGIALSVAWLSPTRTVFWFVIFGWSGIAATFCPTMILSLLWKGMQRQGAIAAMCTGFVCVPLFKFVAPKVPAVGPFFGTLEELIPSFFLSMVVVGIIVSKLSSEKQEG